VLGKFNEIRPGMYREFMKVHCQLSTSFSVTNAVSVQFTALPPTPEHGFPHYSDSADPANNVPAVKHKPLPLLSNPKPCKIAGCCREAGSGAVALVAPRGCIRAASTRGADRADCAHLCGHSGALRLDTRLLCN
jgi:hypothetical protein